MKGRIRNQQPRFSLLMERTLECVARLVLVDDWSSVVGGEAFVVQDGLVIRYGLIESTTHDERIAWVAQHGAEPRLMVEKSEDHELWIAPAQLQAG